MDNYTDPRTLSYDEARQATETDSLRRLVGQQKTFSQLVHSASLTGFNAGAEWAQANPEENKSLEQEALLERLRVAEARVAEALRVFDTELRYGDPEGPFKMRDALKADYPKEV